MRIDLCVNPACGRPFQVNEFAGIARTESVPQQIICPHCAHAQPLPGDVTYLVHALSADEEAAFNATMRWMDANASVDPVE